MKKANVILALGTALLLAPPASIGSYTLYLRPDQAAYGTGSIVYRDSELDVGFRQLVDGTHEYRAALRFPLPPSLSSAFIQRATLSLYYFGAWGNFNNRTIFAHRVLGPWTEAAPFFGVQRAPASSSALVGGQNYRWINWDVTDAARLWAANPDTNFGVMLVPDQGGTLDNAFRFISQRLSTNYTILQIDYTAPPQITQDPVGQTALVGDNISFLGFAGGTDSISYQWQKDSRPIPGAYAPYLYLDNIQLTNAGSYTLVATNVAGSVTSAPAVLIVRQPPTFIEFPADQTVGVGSNVTLMAQAASTYPIDYYQWFHNDAPISGATSPSLVLNNVQPSDAGRYSLAISNQLGEQWSSLWLYVRRMPFTPPPEVWRVPFAVTNAGYYSQPLLAEDPSGAIILLTGVKDALYDSSPALLLGKVSAGGVKLWETTYQEPYGRALVPSGLTTDPVGNIFVATHSRFRFYVLKFAPDGQRLWASARDIGWELGSISSVQIIPDPLGFVTVWGVGTASADAWQGTVEYSGGWVFLDHIGNFLNQQQFSQVDPLTVRVANSTNLSTLAWSATGSDFGVYTVDMLRSTNLSPQLWSATSAPVLSVGAMVRESPVGVHVVTASSPPTLQLFSRSGSPLWPQLAVPIDGLKNDSIPALETDSEGNTYFAASFNGSLDNDLRFCRVRPSGELAWVANYSDAVPLTNLYQPVFDFWLQPDGAGGLYVVVHSLRPQLLRFSSRGVRLWDLDESRSVPARDDLLFGACPLLVSKDQSVTLAVRDLSGGAAPRNLYLVRRAFSNAPPVIAITAPLGGTTVPTNALIQVTAAASDSNADVDYAEFFLDGRPVGVAGNRPFALTIPPVAAGAHFLSARAFDRTGLFAAAPTVFFYSGASPTQSVIKAEDLHQTLFSTIAAENLRQAETNLHGQMMAALVDVVAEVNGRASGLAPQFYGDLIHAVAAVVPPPSTNPPPDLPQNEFWQGWLGGYVKPALQSLVPTWGASALVAKQAVDEMLGTYGSPSDASLSTATSEAVRYGAQRWTNLMKLHAQARQNPAFGAAVFRTELAEVIRADVNASNPQFLTYLRNNFGSAPGQMGYAAAALQPRLDAGENLHADLGLLDGLWKSQNDFANAGIRAQLELNQKLMEYTEQIFSYTSNQTALAELNSQIQREEKRRLDLENHQREGWQGALNAVAQLMQYGGFNDGRKVEAVREQGYRFLESLNQFNKRLVQFEQLTNAVSTLDKAKSLLSTLSTVKDAVGAVFTLVSVLNSQSAPSEEEIISQQLGQIRDMINQLGQQMNQRFDRLDRELQTIYDTFSREFASIDLRFGQFQLQLVSIRGSLDLINQKLDTIQRSQYLLARDVLRADFDRESSQLDGWVPGVHPISYNDFNTLRGDFYVWATSNAQYEAFSPVGLSTNDDQLVQSLAAAGQPTASLSFLARLAAGRGWLPTTSPFRGLQRNPVEWEAGVSEYLRLIETWPLIAKSAPIVTNNLQQLRAVGESLDNALRSLSLSYSSGQLRANRGFWQALFGFYRSKAANMVQTITNLEDSYRQLRLAPNPDTNLVAAARATQLWGELYQRTGFVPLALRGTMAYSGPAGGINGGDLEVPSGFATGLENGGLVLPFFAELLSQATNAPNYGSISLIDQRIRRSYLNPNHLGGYPSFTRILESRLRMSVKLDITMTGGDDGWTGARGTAASARYTHPDFHFDSWEFYWPNTNSLFSRGQYDNRYTVIEEDFSAYWSWNSSSQQVLSYWYGDQGGGEPRADVPSATLALHPEWGRHSMRAARDLFGGTAISNYLDSAISAADPQAATFRQVLERRVEQRLRSLQAGFYAKVMSDFRSDTNALKTVAAELDGAREVLETFLRLAFPQSFEGGDALASFFAGAEPLPDSGEVIHLCSQGVLLSANSADHRERIQFDQIFNQRLTALEATVSNRLTEIEVAGQAESLPLLVDALNRIADAQSLLASSASPAWLSISAEGATSLTVGVFGQPNVPYILQYSTNLTTWTDFNPPITVYDGMEQPIPPIGANILFIRARSSE